MRMASYCLMMTGQYPAEMIEGGSTTNTALAPEGKDSVLLHQPPAMTEADRRQYKASMVEALDNVGGEFHIVAQLPIGRSRAALEDTLYAWAGRIDRYYL